MRALGRNLDLAVFADVGDGGILQRFLHGIADLRARAAQEALAVAEALAFGIETAVDEVGHGQRLSRYPALLTRMYHSTRRRT